MRQRAIPNLILKGEVTFHLDKNNFTACLMGEHLRLEGPCGDIQWAQDCCGADEDRQNYGDNRVAKPFFGQQFAREMVDGSLLLQS